MRCGRLLLLFLFCSLVSFAYGQTEGVRETLQEKIARLSRENMEKLESQYSADVSKDSSSGAGGVKANSQKDLVENSLSSDEKFSLMDAPKHSENGAERAGEVSAKNSQGESQPKDELIEKLNVEISRVDKEISDEQKILDKLFSESQKIFTYSTRRGTMQIFSKSSQFAQFGLDVAQKVESSIEPFFPLEFFKILKPDSEAAARIEIYVLNPDEAVFKGDFYETHTNFGVYKLSVKMRKDFPIKDFFERLLVLQIKAIEAGFNGTNVSRAQIKIPYWIRLALRVSLSREMSEGLIQSMTDFSEKNLPDNIANVLKYEAAKDENLYYREMSSYWTLLALKSMLSKGVYETFIKLALTEKSPDVILKKLPIIALVSEETFYETLRMAQLAEMFSRAGGVMNFEKSDAEIARLSVIFKTNTGEPLTPIFVPQIYELAPDFESQIQQRIGEIKYNLSFINPAYMNALISLGQMYDAAILQDKIKFDSAQKSFKRDLINAREIAKASHALMQSKE